MARNNDLQELLQLAQLAQLVNGPAVQERQLAQTGDNQRLQAALAILGLQHQTDSDAAMRAFRESEATREGQQFERGLSARTAEAEADRTFRGEQAFKDRALRGAEFNESGRRFDTEQAMREQAFKEANRQFGEKIGLDRSMFMDQAMRGDEALGLQREELGQRKSIAGDELRNRQLLSFVDALTGNPNIPPDESMAALSVLMPEMAPANAAMRGVQNKKKLAGFLPMIQGSNDPAARDTIISTAPEELRPELLAAAARKQHESWDPLGLLPSDWPGQPSALTPAQPLPRKPIRTWRDAVAGGSF